SAVSLGLDLESQCSERGSQLGLVTGSSAGIYGRSWSRPLAFPPPFLFCDRSSRLRCVHRLALAGRLLGDTSRGYLVAIGSRSRGFHLRFLVGRRCGFCLFHVPSPSSF
ncbi:hypothetical protein FRC08_016369, partial [Ceratobasidium sp. 394]